MGLYLFCVNNNKNIARQLFDLRVHFTAVHVWNSLESPEQLLTGKYSSTTWLRQVRFRCCIPVSHVTLHVLHADQSVQRTVYKKENTHFGLKVQGPK